MKELNQKIYSHIQCDRGRNWIDYICMKRWQVFGIIVKEGDIKKREIVSREISITKWDIRLREILERGTYTNRGRNFKDINFLFSIVVGIGFPSMLKGILLKRDCLKCIIYHGTIIIFLIMSNQLLPGETTSFLSECYDLFDW